MDTQTLFQKAVIDLGFRSEKEFFRMVAKVDLTSILKTRRFKKWQYEDGTKEGLKKILKIQERS